VVFFSRFKRAYKRALASETERIVQNQTAFMCCAHGWHNFDALGTVLKGQKETL